MVLAVDNLSLEFEGLRALTGVSMSVARARWPPWSGPTAPARRVC